MKTPVRNKAFISQLTAVVLAAVCCFASATFAVVWQHQNNVRIAKENNSLENGIASVFRQQTQLAKQIADEQTFDALNRRNASFHLNLSAIREQQLVRVTIDPRTRLDMKRNVERIGYLPPYRETDKPAATTNVAPAPARFVTFSR